MRNIAVLGCRLESAKPGAIDIEQASRHHTLTRVPSMQSSDSTHRQLIATNLPADI